MALQESAPEFDCFGQKNTKPISSSENSTGFCECNICLDQARDPVVTLCGHLYCWPCIFKWLHIKSNKQPKCPICKARISDSSLVPLYGRGNPSSDTGSGLKRSDPSDLVIPSRPSAPSGYYLSPDQQIHPNPSQSQLLNHPSYGLGPVFGPRVTVSSPFVAMVGEMVCAMIFRGSGPGLFGGYRYENVYLNGSPRMRRQVMPVEKSLNRLTIFFFCCFLLCLLLF